MKLVWRERRTSLRELQEEPSLPFDVPNDRRLYEVEDLLEQILENVPVPMARRRNAWPYWAAITALSAGLVASMLSQMGSRPHAANPSAPFIAQYEWNGFYRVFPKMTDHG